MLCYQVLLGICEAVLPIVIGIVHVSRECPGIDMTGSVENVIMNQESGVAAEANTEFFKEPGFRDGFAGIPEVVEFHDVCSADSAGSMRFSDVDFLQLSVHVASSCLSGF